MAHGLSCSSAHRIFPNQGSNPCLLHRRACARLVTQSCRALCGRWTVAHQAPLSVGFFRQEYWSGSPFPSPGHLLDPGIEPRSPALQADSLPTELQGKPYMGHTYTQKLFVVYLEFKCNQASWFWVMEFISVFSLSINFRILNCYNENVLFLQYAAAAKSLQSCPTLCNPMSCSMPGLPVHHQLLEFTQTLVH